MANANAFGQLKQIDFMDNIGGLNLTDTVFKITPDQAAGGFNFDYLKTGGVRKRMGISRINTYPNASLYTLGLGLYAPISGTSKSVFRAAGTKLQLLNPGSGIGSFSNLTDDTSLGGSDPFALGTTSDVVFSQFSTALNDILWGTGGGATLPVGAYSTSNYTTNGVASPSGTFSGSVNAHGGGSWSSGNVGIFYYSFVWRKRSTGALSNASEDFTVTTVNTDDTVSIVLTPPSDITLYDQVWIYRSAVAGSEDFTTGSLIATLNSTATSFIDLGNIGNPDLLSAQNIPRPANIILDNSQLPDGPYTTIALWGHRLCTSSGNSLYISDVNKSESWPLTNYITVPSAGPITGLATISFTSPQANSLQELLVIFKERELWVLTPGASYDYTTWSLLRIDSNTGCPNQVMVVSAQGFLAWVDYRGVWLWDGSSKPTYCSRPIESMFGAAGDLDKSAFQDGCGAFFRRQNQIMWYLSSKTYGTQKIAIKMDVRLTTSKIEQDMTGRIMDGVFTIDTYNVPVYAALSYLPLNAQNEQLIVGDDAGYCYYVGNASSDVGQDYSFKYLTAPITCGNVNIKKQWHKVIVWVQSVGQWNLYLDYWTDFKSSSTYESSQGLPITTENNTQALWDIAKWDVSTWNGYNPSVVPIVFNLQSGSYNNSQGSAIQLQFRNDTANQPITIHGYSLVYSELGGITQ